MLFQDQVPPPKRVLTKVRRHFTIKKDEEGQNNSIDPSTRYLSDNNVYTLSASIGLVEINRKICIGPQYLNQHFSISKSSIQDKSTSRAVLLSLCSNQTKPFIPCEYTMKRLESYGDLELATWAHRMMRFQRNYPKLMEEYLLTRELDNPIDVKEKLCKMREEIENNNSYYKIVRHYSQKTSELSEISYSEDFIKAMGHSIESFLSWTTENGLPPVFDHECSAYLHAAKSLLDGNTLSGKCTTKAEEIETFIIDERGGRRSVQVKSIYLLEPTQEGFSTNLYFILSKASPKMKFRTVQKELKMNIWKQTKMESHFEGSMEIEP